MDAGSQPLVNGVFGYIQNNPEIKNMNIFITHFHLDHVQALAGLIKNSMELQITIYLHRDMAMQFAGWLLENLSHILKTNFTVILLDHLTTTKIDGINVSAKPLLYDTFKFNHLKHYIKCTSWVFSEAGRCAKLFTGDFNPPNYPNQLSPDDLHKAIKLYFEQMFTRIYDRSKCANVFLDYGHFSTFISQDGFNAILKLVNTKGFHVAWYLEHNKMTTGYNSVNISLNSLIPNEENANMYKNISKLGIEDNIINIVSEKLPMNSITAKGNNTKYDKKPNPYPYIRNKSTQHWKKSNLPKSIIPVNDNVNKKILNIVNPNNLNTSNSGKLGKLEKKGIVNRNSKSVIKEANLKLKSEKDKNNIKLFDILNNKHI